MKEETKTAEIINTRKKYCIKKTDELRQALQSNEILKELTNTCIYATGSLARFEATENSDLDLFFIARNNEISNIKSILHFAEIIKINERLGFPDFSRDGGFLKIHTVNDLLKIGDPIEDYANFFTARMLLLLESNSLLNDDVYNEIIDKIVNSYFRDFHKHMIEFNPFFLLNDIIRYWKTLCLNYEHRRKRDNPKLSQEEQAEYKLKAHKNNLKLRFSRKFTCFSFVLSLADAYVDKKNGIQHNVIKEIIKLTPIERLQAISDKHENLNEPLYRAMDLYGYFLELSKETFDWISDKSNRDEAFKKSREFGEELYKILAGLLKDQNSDFLRYIIF